MTSVLEYIIKVVCASVLCGILNQIVKGIGTVPAILKTISGIFIAVTVISPLFHIRLDVQTNFMNEYFEKGMHYSDDGESIAMNQKSELIKSATQSYILDKAVSLGAELEVEVVLGNDEEDPYESVLLLGEISPYAKNQLSLLIAKELGIPEEEQQWIS